MGDLFERAGPRCRECGEPIQRTDVVYDRWEVLGLAPVWKPRAAFVCPNEHREPLEERT